MVQIRGISFSASALLKAAEKRVASGFVQGLMRIELAFSHRKLASTEGLCRWPLQPCLPFNDADANTGPRWPEPMRLEAHKFNFSLLRRWFTELLRVLYGYSVVAYRNRTLRKTVLRNV